MAQQVKVCWLSGNSHERKLVLEKIKSQFPDAEVATFDDQISYAYLEQQVYTTSCFVEKKIIILKALPQPAGTKQTMINHFKKLCENLPEDTLLVFNGIEGEKALQTHVGKVGKVIESDIVLEKEKAASWVMKTVQEHGKTIELEDAQAAVDLNGYDGEAKGIGVDQLRIAVLKLCQYIGRKKQITHDDVTVCSFPSEEFIIWSIFDAMDTKNLENCLNQMHKMFRDAGGTTEGVNKLLHLALWRYRLIFFLKEAQAKGLTRPQVVQEALQLTKLQQSGTGSQMKLTVELDESGTPKAAYTEYVINNILNSSYNRTAVIEHYNRKELVRIILAIEEGMTEVRYRTSEASLGIIADQLMLTVCSAMDDNHLSKVRNSYAE